jgi:DNA-directed RNA polymerase specialized sigma24 family protein
VTDEIDPPEELVRDHWELVRAWIRRDRRHSAAAPLDTDAITGNVFEEALRIWRRTPPAERHPREAWAPWLRTIMKYKIQEAVREQAGQRNAVQALYAQAVPHQNQVRDTADDVVSRKFLESVRDRIGDLPDPDRTLLLAMWGGASVGEAAARVGLSRAAAGMRVTRIRRYLKGAGGFADPGDGLRALRETLGRGER